MKKAPNLMLYKSSYLRKSKSIRRNCEEKRKSWIAMKYTSSETQGRLAGARGNKSGKEMKRRTFTSKAERALSALLVNMRRFISLPDLFPLAPANRPWVSEDVKYTVVIHD